MFHSQLRRASFCPTLEHSLSRNEFSCYMFHFALNVCVHSHFLVQVENKIERRFRVNQSIILFKMRKLPVHWQNCIKRYFLNYRIRSYRCLHKCTISLDSCHCYYAFQRALGSFTKNALYKFTVIIMLP